MVQVNLSSYEAVKLNGENIKAFSRAKAEANATLLGLSQTKKLALGGSYELKIQR